jgi:cytochrome c2
MRALALALSLSALAACSASRGAAGPDEGSADARAARLYRAKCSACHRAYEPATRTGAEWSEILDAMAPRAHLRDGERALLLDYLRAHARDAGEKR